MERAKQRIVRLLICDLAAPEDSAEIIASSLLDYSLAWLWLCCYNCDEGKHKVTPEQAMGDFGLDEGVPGDWLVWSEQSDKSISVIQDLRVLHGLGVRGHFIINEVGTTTLEKWTISDRVIHIHTRGISFEGDPDTIIPISPMSNILKDHKLTEE